MNNKNILVIGGHKGIVDATFRLADIIIGDPHTCGLTCIPNVLAVIATFRSSVIPPTLITSGWAMSYARLARKFWNSYLVRK